MSFPDHKAAMATAIRASIPGKAPHPYEVENLARCYRNLEFQLQEAKRKLAERVEIHDRDGKSLMRMARMARSIIQECEDAKETASMGEGVQNSGRILAAKEILEAMLQESESSDG